MLGQSRLVQRPIRQHVVGLGAGWVMSKLLRGEAVVQVGLDSAESSH
jgi:hypothetical protein